MALLATVDDPQDIRADSLLSFSGECGVVPVGECVNVKRLLPT